VKAASIRVDKPLIKVDSSIGADKKGGGGGRRGGRITRAEGNECMVHKG
jgi:hypothetical protein